MSLEKCIQSDIFQWEEFSFLNREKFCVSIRFKYWYELPSL